MKNEQDSERNGELYNANSSVTTDCGGIPMPDNVTSTRPDHANAQARVLVSGLSVFGFNQADARAEFGFIKAMHSDLKMEIYEKSSMGPIWSTANPANFPFPNTKDITININSTTTGIGRRFEINPLGDPEDFRRMQSFHYWHAQRLSFKHNAKAFLTARVNVMKGDFYTYQLSRSMAIEIKTRKSPPKTQYTNKGVIGRILGADIFSNESHLVIDLKVHNRTHRVRLPNSNGTQYTIVLTTIAHDHGHGHIKHIYDNVLDNQDGYEYDIQFNPPEMLWRYRVFGDKRSGVYHTDFSEELAKLSSKDMEIFDSIEEAMAKNYKPSKKVGIKSVQFACECLDGGCPPQPDIS